MEYASHWEEKKPHTQVLKGEKLDISPAFPLEDVMQTQGTCTGHLFAGVCLFTVAPLEHRCWLPRVDQAQVRPEPPPGGPDPAQAGHARGWSHPLHLREAANLRWLL